MQLTVPVALGALLLTACGSDDDGGSGDGTYKIAFQGPLSGQNVALGENMERGIQLAITEANESGEHDFTLEYLPADDQGQESQANSAAQSVIDDPDVMAAVGPAFSGPANVAAPLYGRAQLTAISPSATTAELTEQGYPTFLRAVPNDNAQGSGMATFLAGEGVDHVMVIDDVSPYGQGLADVAEAELDAAGIQVERESVPADTVDYSSAARNVVSSGADAMIYAGYYEAAGPFAVKLTEAGFDGLKVSGDGTRDPEFVNLAGGAADGWHLTCACTDPTEEEATQAFAERYAEEFGGQPGTYAAESYDVASMVIEAIAELGSDVSREGVYEQLAGMEFEGLTKTFGFDENGEFTNDAVFLYEVRDGEIDYLGEVEELAAAD